MSPASEKYAFEKSKVHSALWLTLIWAATPTAGDHVLNPALRFTSTPPALSIAYAQIPCTPAPELLEMGNCRRNLVLCCHILGLNGLGSTAQARDIRKDLLGQKGFGN